MKTMTSFFRITVNLSNFFADHRRQVRICVNDSIQTIGDLQNKISGIFDVHNLYLVCDNDFLPPSEDIHVLQNNDLVWALPDTTIAQESHNVHSTSLDHKNLTESIKANCGRKKRKTLENVTSDHYLETEDVLPKKKCRRSEKQVDDNQDIVDSERGNKCKLTENGTDSGIKEKNHKRKKEKKEKTASPRLDTIQEIVNPVEKKKKKQNRFIRCMGSDYGYEFDNFEAETVDSVEKKKKKQNRFIRCMGSDYGFEFENFKADKTKKNKKKTDLDETNSLEHSKPSNSVSDGKKEQENNENTSPSTNTNCNQMVCNGDLASYTRKQPVPTTTDEYLKEKKINIVRIDYVTTKDTTKCYQSQNSKCIANDQFSNIPKVSLLTNTSPIKFAPELTSIEECKSASSQKSTSNQSTDILNKNKQDMKRSEESKSDNFLNDPPQTSTANETHVTQFENVMVVNGKKSAQQCDFEFSLETDKNSQIKKGSTPAAKECRIIDSLNQNPAEHSKDPKVSKERSGIVSEGTELNISSVNNNAQTLTMDVNTPKNKEWSYKEISPLSETLLAGFTSSVLESTQSIAVDDIYVKSPSVSGCHWLQSENKSPKPKHKELSGVGQILENLRSVSNDEPQDPFNVDAFVTLRKRKRSRHRSKKNRFELDKSLTLTPKTEPIPKLMITEVSPSIHIKFDEDGKEDLMNSKSGNQKCPVAGDNTNDGSHLEPYFEMIQKATPMKDMVPKVGDTIAFKISKRPDPSPNGTLLNWFWDQHLRRNFMGEANNDNIKVLKMSENYTPEVSAYIIGNVMKYNPSHGLIKFNIKAGLEELKQPNGKLSIVEDDVKEGQYKEYLWTDLIEPRLFS